MSYTVMRQGGYTPLDCVKFAVELGMDGIDWVTTYGEDPRYLKKISDEAGLPVVAYTFFVRESDCTNLESYMEKSLDEAAILGAPLVMIPPSNFPGVEDPAENRKRWCEVLCRTAPIAEARNITLTVENFPGAGSAFVTADDFYEAKALVPSLKLTYDDGNAATGEDPVESVKRCIKDIVHVHFKDWNFSTSEGRLMKNGLYGTPALIGEGDVPSLAVLEELERSGYNGYINIEYESNHYPAREAIAKALQFLKQGK